MTDVLVDSKCGFNYFKLRDPENSLTIKPYADGLAKSRAEDVKSLMRSVNDIRRDLETLKCDVHSFLKTQNTDGLKKNMFKIEENISSLKSSIKQEFLELLKSETSLLKDIQFIEKRVEEWGKPVDNQFFKSTIQSKYKGSQSPINGENPIVEFQKFLSSTGGHYGGWEEQDHLLFMKENEKYKKKEKFVSAVHCLLPDISIEEIEEHEKWYQKYKSLQDAKKHAIQKWRLEKETQQKKEKGKEENGEEKRKTKKMTQQQIDIAERIKEWKSQQLIKKLEEKERQKKEKEKFRQEKKKKLELQRVKKLAIAKYKEEKLVKEIYPEEDKRLLIQEAKARNKIFLKAFRLQDLEIIEKKKIIRLQIETKSREKFKRLRLAKPALNYILQRDPQRIFQPTIIWNQHCSDSQKRKKIDPIFDLNSIPRLAIPEWRRALK